MIIFFVKFIFITVVLFIVNFISCDNRKSNNVKFKKKLAISFKDQIGQIINLEKPAKSIVMMPWPGPVVLISIDNSVNRLKGMNPSTVKGFSEGIMRDFFPEVFNVFTDIVTNNFVPNVEELLRVNPDLIFQWGISEKYIKHIDMMKKLGLKVAAFQLSIKNDVSVGWIKMVGESIGKIKKANKLIEWRTKLLNFFQKATKKIPDKDRLRTLYFMQYHKAYRIRELIGIPMDIFNVKNPSRSNKELTIKIKTINIEHIIKWNPEIILLNGFEKNLSPSDIYRNELFSEVSAIKNKRVYKIPIGGYLWDPPSNESPLYWMWISMILYPNYFNFDLRKEIKTWYKIMYKKIPTNDQINSIFRINMNKNSKNYEKFME